jgi:hypothetical protein
MSSPLSQAFVDWLTADVQPERKAYELAFGGAMRMGEGRSIIWRYLLGIITAPGAHALRTLSNANKTNGDASSDDEDEIFEYYEVELNKTRAIYSGWEAERKTRIAPTKAAAAAAKPKAKVAGPRFGDDSDDTDDDEEEAASPTAARADNPLNATESSAWGKYFQKQKVLELIDKDLGRLWGGVEFFEDDEVKAHMRDVLECLLDTDIVSDYCQGMHELLSLVYMVLSLDATEAAKLASGAPQASTLRLLCSAKWIKHDSYSILRKILTSRDGGLGVCAWYEADPDNDDDRPVVHLSERIQNQLLGASDPELSKHLKSLDVHPAAYGLRYLRLLYLREFPFGQSAALWDAIFADHKWNGNVARQPDGFVPRIAVAMLIYIRQDLLDPDYGSVLRRLMRFPPVESVKSIVQRAVIGAHGANSEEAILCGVATSLLKSHSAEETSTAANATQASARPSSIEASPKGNATTFDPPSLIDAHSISKPVASPLRGPTRREQDVGTALAKVIDTMGTKWFPATNGVPDSDADVDYILAIAELKKLRDVLLHGLPMD